MIFDSLILCLIAASIMLAIFIIVVLGVSTRNIFSSIILSALAFDLGLWLHKADQYPFTIKREVICQMTNIMDNGKCYQIIKDGNKIYNITAEKGELYPLNKMVKLTYYNNSKCGIIFTSQDENKPDITIIDKITTHSESQ